MERSIMLIMLITIYSHKQNWIADYSKIKSLFPANWKGILRSEEAKHRQVELINTKTLNFTPNKIILNGKIYNYK